MNIRTRMLLALGAPVVAAGLLLGASPAHAGGFADTAVQIEHQHVDAITSFTATLAAPAPAQAVTISPSPAVTFTPAQGDVITFAATGVGPVTFTLVSGPSPVVAGETFAVTNGALAATLNQGATPAALTQSVTFVVKATDAGGAVAIGTLVVAPVANGGMEILTFTPHLVTVSGADDNTHGTVVFTPATGLTLGNAPAGLTLVSGVLSGSTTPPGEYHGVTVTEADGGAAAVDTLELRVMAHRAVSPVCVLSHGHAISTSPVHETVFFFSSADCRVKFVIHGPGLINGHVGFVNARRGLNAGFYWGLEANHTYFVVFTPVDAAGNPLAGGHPGTVDFISNH